MSKITFELNNKEYTLPEVLTIEDYIKVYKVKDFLGEQFFQAKLISTITGADMESILKTNHTQITFLANHIASLFPDTSYPFTDKFVLNGVEYGFIPSWKNMSFAEFVDLDTLLNKKPEEIIENLHIICSIMYRPIVSKKKEHQFKIEDYDVDEMVERAELFKKELDVKYVLGGQFFFSRFVSQYLNPSPTSLILRSKNFWNRMVFTWKMRRTIWKILLGKPLDGTQLSIDYAMMTLQSITKSQKSPLWKRLTNLRILSERRGKNKD